MALTRAQYLAGGLETPKLAGQPQGVKPGSGIAISADGTIIVDAATSTGLVKLNNIAALNSYVWPNVIPDTAAGFAVMTVSKGTNQITWVDPSAIGGVTRIKAGTNIVVTPATGVGEVTISSTGELGASGPVGLQLLDTIAPLFNGSRTSLHLQVGGINLPTSVTRGMLFMAIGGVIQSPETAFDYNPTTSTITFTGAPPVGATFSGWAGGATNNGTITGVIPGPGLNGGGTSGKVTLYLDPPKNGELGGVKQGTGISIAADGTISTVANQGFVSETDTMKAQIKQLTDRIEALEAQLAQG